MRSKDESWFMCPTLNLVCQPKEGLPKLAVVYTSVGAVKFSGGTRLSFLLFEIGWVVREWSNIPAIRPVSIAPAQSGK